MPLAASASAYYVLMTLYEKHNNCSVSPQSELLLPD